MNALHSIQRASDYSVFLDTYVYIHVLWRGTIYTCMLQWLYNIMRTVKLDTFVQMQNAITGLNTYRCSANVNYHTMTIHFNVYITEKWMHTLKHFSALASGTCRVYTCVAM